MKSTLLSAFVVALMVTESACSSNSGGSAETGDAGGTNARGSTSSNGSGDDQNKQSAGGAADSSGAQANGGTALKGTTTKGGASGSVSASTARQTTPSGGLSSTSNADTATGGAVSSGGARESAGGVVGAGGATNGKAQGGSGAIGGKTQGGSGATGGKTQTDTAVRSRQIKTRGFTFDALEAGPDDGEPVLLLHGFPEISLEWSGLMPVLAAAGYRCLAPDQRGYSPGARPTEVDAYKYEELVADGFAFGSELGERFHVVAHDWGANIAWLMLQKDPSRIASFTTLAVPHYQVWARAVYEDPEMKQYLSMLTTWSTPEKGEAFWTESAMRSMWKAKPADQVDQTIAHMLEPGCMTAALNWYRASNAQKSVIEDYEPWEVSVPTLLIFGSTDIGQKTVTDTKPLMKGPYRVVQPKGGHFIVDEQPKVVADETLAQLKAYPIQ